MTALFVGSIMPKHPARLTRAKQLSRAVRRDPAAGPSSSASADPTAGSRDSQQQLFARNRALASEVQEARDRLAATMQSVREQLARMRMLSVQSTLAEQQERQAIASQYREQLLQLLVGIKFRLTVLAQAYDPADTDLRWRDLATLLDLAMRESRQIGSALAPHVLENEELLPTLHWLVGWMRERYAFTVDLVAVPPIATGEPARTLLFHAIRQLVLNAAKHAHVTTARLEVAQHDGHLHVTVSDTGIGFDPAVVLGQMQEGSVGLASTLQVIDYLGGKCDILSAPGHGCRIILSVPAPA